jgi:nucleotide-binding universal stress UspA family protein
MTSAVLACIDGSVYSASVADHAGWAAARLGLGVELLQVLGRREGGVEDPVDRSGRIVAGARRQLLEELAAVDAERSRLLQKQARMDLAEARERVEAAGVSHGVAEMLRRGDLLETLEEREADTALIVVGKRGEAADFAALHLGSNLERILRASHRPTLVASRAFRPIERFVIAFDGRPSALKAVDDASRSPLFQGLSGLLVTAGERSAKTETELEAAARQLRAGGLAVETRTEPGSPNAVIPAAVEETGADLLVMGAYGHSRLRTLVLGSTTSEMIRACRVPILIHR